MTVITNAPRLPGDQPSAPLVAIELLDDNRQPVVGYVSGSSEAVHQRMAFAANGQHALSPALSDWSVDLVPNAQIEPAGTVYRITEQRGRAMAAIHIVEVPENGGPYSVLQTLIDEPGSMGSLLLDHLAVAVDAHDASAVSVEEIAGLDATDVQAALAEHQDDIDDENAARGAAMTAEAAARSAADATLTTNLATEATARAAADAADAAALAAHLSDAVDGHDASAVSVAAIAGLAAADVQSALAEHQSDITAEATARSAADTAESAARAAADSGLAATITALDGDVGTVETAVAAETAARIAAVAAEAAARSAADATEATTRAAADTAGTAALAAHGVATTAVHGIANTANLVLTSDARLSDARPPTDNSVTQAKVAAGSLGIDRLAVDPRARATHTGTQAASTISDLGPVVQAFRLDQFAAPTGPVNINGQRLTNGPLPVALTDFITKEYADALRAGILLKADPVRVMVSTNVNINAPGAVHDGATLSAGVDSILLTSQTSANDNGVYLYNGPAVPLTRRADANTDAEMRSGTAVWVLDGTYTDQQWVLVTADPITLGVTSQAWAFNGGLAHVTAGDGLTKTGNRIDVGEGTGLEVLADSVGIAAGGVTNTEVAADAEVAQSKIAGLPAALATLSAADAALLADILAESAAREAADDTLTADLLAEATARAAADASLQVDVDQVASDLARALQGEPAKVVDFGITVDEVYYPPPLLGVAAPLSEIPGLTLGAAQARYPFVTSLDQQRDFAAFQLAINTVLPGNRLTGQLPNGPLSATAPVEWLGSAYIATDPIVIRGALGFRLKGGGMWVSRIVGSGSPDCLLWLDGVTSGHFSGFLVAGGTPNKGVHYARSTNDELGAGTGVPLRTSSACVFVNIGVQSCDFTLAGWGVGSNDPGMQVDGSTWIGCVTTSTWTEGNTTTGQHGWLVGNGTFGNIYGHTFSGCSAAHVRYGFTGKASSFQIFGFQGGAMESVVHIEGVAGPLTVDTARIEGSQLISSAGGQSSGVNVSVRNVSLNRVAGTAVPAGGRVIDLAGHNGNLSIENLHVTGWGDTGATVPVIRFFGAGLTQQATIEARGVQMPTPIGTAFEVVSTTVVTSFAYTHKDKDSDVGYGAVALWIRIGATVVFTTGADERQLLTLTGGPTGGTFTITFEGQTTAPIAWNANANTIRDALVALSNVGTGEVPVANTGVVNTFDQSPMSVSFTGALGRSNRTQMTANSAGLTGGTAPTVTVTTPVPGINAAMLNVLTDSNGVRYSLGVNTSGALTTTQLA